MRMRSGSADRVVLPVPERPKKIGDVAVLADVDRRVHGQHALVGQPVIHDPEGALLHLAGVVGAADQDLLARQVDEDDRLAARAVALGIGLEGGRVDDREVGLEAGQVCLGGPDEQVVAEDARPGASRCRRAGCGGSSGSAPT